MLPSVLSVVGRRARRWRRDENAAAGVEFALTAPAMLMMMGMIVFAGEGFEVQRKVTMTMRTLTDLVTQQCDVGQPSYSYSAPCPSNTYTYNQIISAASLVMAPYSTTSLNFTIAEIGTSPAAQIWCKNSLSSTANCPGASVPSSLASSAYIIYGNVQYTYNPVGIWFQTAGITFSDSFYMLPRIAPNPAPSPSPTANTPYVACTGC